jgi:two-component sensor histidine kinase
MSLAEEAETRIALSAGARRTHPIATHLALFAVGILTPVLLIVTLMLVDAARLRRDESLRDATAVVRQINATIEVEIEKAISVGQTLATSLALTRGDHVAFDGQAREVANRLGLIIVARDLTGQQIINTAAPVGRQLPISNGSIVAIDRLAAASGLPVISDLVTGTVLKNQFVIADVPVIRDGRVIYFIDVELLPTRIVEILSQGLAPGWLAGVVGRDGRLIARSADLDRFIGMTNPAFLEAAVGREGVWNGTARGGDSISGAYLRSPLSGWIVSVAVPETTLHAAEKWALAWLTGLAVAALAVSTYLGWQLSRRISLPIRDLVLRARELGDGRIPAAAQSSVVEVNDVTEALHAAAVELDRRAETARQSADAVRANEERLQLVQGTAGIGTLDWDIEAGDAVCSARFYEMFSLPPGSRIRFGDILERVHPDQREQIRQSHKLLFRQGGAFEEEFRVLAKPDEERWIHVRGRLDLKNGKPVRLLGASIDVTGRKRSEEHLRFLLREISHRSKNLLAVIIAMAGQTAKSVESVAEFRRRFGERLMGMSASHDLLVNQNWLGASVESLVRGQLVAFVDAQDARVQIAGPTVDLTAEATEALGLALHELASNSLKFGALSDPAGKVEISWTVYGSAGAMGSRDTDADERRFRMEWIEHSVAPVPPPSHKGFGRMVIEHTVRATFRGTVTLDFPEEGLRWCIDAPSSCLAHAGAGATLDAA